MPVSIPATEWSQLTQQQAERLLRQQQKQQSNPLTFGAAGAAQAAWASPAGRGGDQAVQSPMLGNGTAQQASIPAIDATSPVISRYKTSTPKSSKAKTRHAGTPSKAGATHASFLSYQHRPAQPVSQSAQRHYPSEGGLSPVQQRQLDAPSHPLDPQYQLEDTLKPLNPQFLTKLQQLKRRTQVLRQSAAAGIELAPRMTSDEGTVPAATLATRRLVNSCPTSPFSAGTGIRNAADCRRTVELTFKPSNRQQQQQKSNMRQSPLPARPAASPQQKTRQQPVEQFRLRPRQDASPPPACAQARQQATAVSKKMLSSKSAAPRQQQQRRTGVPMRQVSPPAAVPSAKQHQRQQEARDQTSARGQSGGPPEQQQAEQGQGQQPGRRMTWELLYKQHRQGPAEGQLAKQASWDEDSTLAPPLGPRAAAPVAPAAAAAAPGKWVVKDPLLRAALGRIPGIEAAALAVGSGGAADGGRDTSPDPRQMSPADYSKYMKQHRSRGSSRSPSRSRSRSPLQMYGCAGTAADGGPGYGTGVPGGSSVEQHQMEVVGVRTAAGLSQGSRPSSPNQQQQLIGSPRKQQQHNMLHVDRSEDYEQQEQSSGVTTPLTAGSVNYQFGSHPHRHGQLHSPTGASLRSESQVGKLQRQQHAGSSAMERSSSSTSSCGSNSHPREHQQQWQQQQQHQGHTLGELSSPSSSPGRGCSSTTSNSNTRGQGGVGASSKQRFRKHWEQQQSPSSGRAASPLRSSKMHKQQLREGEDHYHMESLSSSASSISFQVVPPHHGMPGPKQQGGEPRLSGAADQACEAPAKQRHGLRVDSEFTSDDDTREGEGNGLGQLAGAVRDKTNRHIDSSILEEAVQPLLCSDNDLGLHSQMQQQRWQSQYQHQDQQQQEKLGRQGVRVALFPKARSQQQQQAAQQGLSNASDAWREKQRMLDNAYEMQDGDGGRLSLGSCHSNKSGFSEIERQLLISLQPDNSSPKAGWQYSNSPQQQQPWDGGVGQSPKSSPASPSQDQQGRGVLPGSVGSPLQRERAERARHNLQWQVLQERLERPLQAGVQAGEGELRGLDNIQGPGLKQQLQLQPRREYLDSAHQGWVAGDDAQSCKEQQRKQQEHLLELARACSGGCSPPKQSHLAQAAQAVRASWPQHSSPSAKPVLDLKQQVEQAVALKAQRMAEAIRSRQQQGQQQQQGILLQPPGGLAKRLSMELLLQRNTMEPEGWKWSVQEGQNLGHKGQEQQQQLNDWMMQQQSGLTLKPIKVQRSYSGWDDVNLLTLPLYDSLGESKSSSLHLGNSARLPDMDDAGYGNGVEELTGSSGGAEGVVTSGSMLSRSAGRRDGWKGVSNGRCSFVGVVEEVGEPGQARDAYYWGGESTSCSELPAETVDFRLGTTEQAFLELLECGALGSSGKSQVDHHLGQGDAGGERLQKEQLQPEAASQQGQQQQHAQAKVAATAGHVLVDTARRPSGLGTAAEGAASQNSRGKEQQQQWEGNQQQEQGGMSPPVPLDYSDSFFSGHEHDRRIKAAGPLSAAGSVTASPAQAHTLNRHYDQNTKQQQQQSSPLHQPQLSPKAGNEQQQQKSPVPSSPQVQQQQPSRVLLKQQQKQQQLQQPGWVRPTARTATSRSQQQQQQRAMSRSAPGKLNDEVRPAMATSKAGTPPEPLSRENSETVEQLRRQKLQEIRKGAARPPAKSPAAPHQPLQQPPFYPAGRSAAVPRRSNMGAQKGRSGGGALPAPPAAPGWRLSLPRDGEGGGGERHGEQFRSEYLQVLHEGEEVRTEQMHP